MMTMRTPKVSAIITTRNEGKYIEPCLRSLRGQTFKDFEIIVSDAESRDDTVKIARRYADKVIVRRTNVSAGRNLGAASARGEILVFIDADTILLPDTLEKVIGAFKNKKVVGATCPILPLTVEAKYVWVYMFYSNFAKATIKMRKPQIAGLFCAYRRDAFNRIGGFDEHVGILEDFHLSRRIASLGRIEFVESTLVLTSHRRLKKLGVRMPDRYLRAWLRMMATGRSFSFGWYNSIR